MASAPSSESLSYNSQLHATMFSHSRFCDINQGNFYRVGGNADIHNTTFYSVGGNADIRNSTSSFVNGLDYLLKFIAPSAFHDPNERFPQPKCHPFTRERILANIIQWFTQEPSKGILWLSGSAGTGKSAISQTVTEMCQKEGLLAAAFFFFRRSPERSTDKHLVATIAYQIASFVPGTKDLITTAVADDLAIFDKDINTQISSLIIHPLLQASNLWTSRFMVVIDGLDECSDEKKQADILGAICDAVTKSNIPLCFLIASRPEPQIRTRFGKRDLLATTVSIVLDEDSDLRRDIEVYLEAEFSRIRLDHNISTADWPGRDCIQSLADRASGQFIFASTVIKFVDDYRHQPHKRLLMVLGATPCGDLSPFAEIDSLYRQILGRVSNIDVALLCFGLMIYGIPETEAMPEDNLPRKVLLPRNLDKLLQLERGEAQLILTDLHSIVNVRKGVAGLRDEISIRHKSLGDFLTDKSRSGKYFLDGKFIKGEIGRLFLAAIGDFVIQLKDSASLSAGKFLQEFKEDAAVQRFVQAQNEAVSIASSFDTGKLPKEWPQRAEKEDINLDALESTASSPAAENVLNKENVTRALSAIRDVMEGLKAGAPQIAQADEAARRLHTIFELFFSSKLSCKSLLKFKGGDAKVVLNSLQWLLDYPRSNSSQRSRLLSLLLRLSRKSGLYPECIILKDIVREDDCAITSGHFGEIWKGMFRDQKVSLKVVKIYQQTQVDHLLQVFAKEAILWSQLSHPNLLPFYGIYHLEDGHGRVCLVSPWMDNGNIRDYLPKNPKVDRVLLVSDVAAGVEYLHRKNIVHGDLKGVNILVTESGKACLADFGLSNHVDAEMLLWTSESSAGPKGTVRWQAPELFDPENENSKLTKETDVYAFSCVCYEIFTCQVPFYEVSREPTVMMKVMSGKRPSRPDKNSAPYIEWGLTDSIWRLMEQCWDRDPENRPTMDRISANNLLSSLVDNRPSGEGEAFSPPQFRGAMHGFL